jgi:hypothetical protein
MQPLEPLPDRLRQLFFEQFTVADIAEVCASFDAERPADEVRAFMEARDFSQVGVRAEGFLRGYVRLEELSDGTCGDVMREFSDDDVLPESASLLEVIKAVGVYRRCFVSGMGEVIGIVTLRDFEKPAVRMWLFGLITMVEMRLVEEIRHRHPHESWTAELSEGRVAKARQLCEERQRRKQSVELIDCLQFSDKAQIVLRIEEIRERMGVASRESGQKLFRRLEELRNNLAHAQELAATDWKSIVGVALRMEQILGVR